MSSPVGRDSVWPESWSRLAGATWANSAGHSLTRVRRERGPQQQDEEEALERRHTQVGGEIQVTRALPLAFYFHRRCLRLSCFFRLLRRRRAQQCKNIHSIVADFFSMTRRTLCCLNAHLALAFIGARLAARELNLSMRIARLARIINKKLCALLMRSYCAESLFLWFLYCLRCKYWYLTKKKLILPIFWSTNKYNNHFRIRRWENRII